MVITMKEDTVNIYNMSESQYENYLEVGTDEYRIKKYCVKSIPKEEYSPSLLKGDAARATTYYYDNGNTMVKKSIQNINDISYYRSSDGKLWPSREFYNYKKSNKNRVFPLNRELTELDYRLNNSVHIDQLFQDDLLTEFKFYYESNNQNITKDKVLSNKYYNVLTYVKLILNPAKVNRDTLTANKLKNYLCLIVTPIGMTQRGDVKYSIVEFPLANYTSKIQSEFTIILHENNMTAKNLKPNERFDFLESAAIRVIHSIQDEILERTNSVIFNGNGCTWKEYCEKFLLNYKYDLCNFNADKWKIYIETLVDARTVHNGYIVPLVIENEHLRAQSTNKPITVRSMNSIELLEPESNKINNDVTKDEVSIVDKKELDVPQQPIIKLDDIVDEPYIVSELDDTDPVIEDIDDSFVEADTPDEAIVTEPVELDNTQEDDEFDISSVMIQKPNFDILTDAQDTFDLTNEELEKYTETSVDENIITDYDYEAFFNHSINKNDVGGRKM